MVSVVVRFVPAGVLAGQQVDDLERVLDDADSHQLAVVATFIIRELVQTLHDGGTEPCGNAWRRSDRPSGAGSAAVLPLP